MKIDNQTHGEFTALGEVRFKRLLPGPIERVWAYLTDPEKRGLWLAGGSVDLRVGGENRMEFDNTQLAEPTEPVPEKYRDHAEDGCSFSGIITRYEPPHVFSHTWSEADGSASEVTFELTPQGDDVLLVLTHRKLGDDHEELLSVSAGWHTHLGILMAKLKDEAPLPFWSTHMALEKQYEERLPVSA